MLRFVLLAFGITWLLVTPLVLGAMGVIAAPPPWLHGLGALGPILAAYWSPRDRPLFATRHAPAMSRPWVVVSLASPLLLALAAVGVVAMRGTPIVRPLPPAVLLLSV